MMAWTTHYNQEIRTKFGEKAVKERLSLTPGTPRFTAVRLENLEDKINPEEHETYRSGVGTLMYLTKHSRLSKRPGLGCLHKPMSFQSRYYGY